MSIRLISFLIFTLFFASGCDFLATLSSAIFSFEDSQHSSLAADDNYLYRSIRHSFSVNVKSNRKIEKVDINTGVATIIAGNANVTQTDGVGPAASFSSIEDMVYVAGTPGMLYIAESCKIRSVNTSTFQVLTVVGNSTCSDTNGVGTAATLDYVKALTFSGTNLYAASAGHIKKIALSNFAVSNFVGSSTDKGLINANGDNARFDGIRSITAIDDKIYVIDESNRVIRAVDINTKDVTTLIGNGGNSQIDGTINASFIFSDASRITSDNDKVLFVTDLNKIRKILLTSPPEVISINQQGLEAGDIDGNFNEGAKVYYPSGIVYSSQGLFISNFYGVRRMR